MTVQGQLDMVSRRRIHGWAWDPAQPTVPLAVIITANGAVIARVLANRYREDLRLAGIGNGRFSFDVFLETPLPATQSLVAVRAELDGSHLPGSPMVMPGVVGFDDDAVEIVTEVLKAVEDGDEISRALTFLAGQMELLREREAVRRSKADEAEARRLARWSGSAAAPDERRALVIDDWVPRPGRDAGSNAVLSHMRSLQRLGYAVTLVPSDLAGDAHVLDREEVAVVARPWVSSVEEVLRREAGRFDLVYLHRAGNAGRYAPLVRHYQPRARVLYSVADLHFLRFARQAAVEDRPELAAYGRQMQRVELTAAWYADAVITHSSAEAVLLRKTMPAEKVHVIPWAVPVRPTMLPFGARQGFAFVAHYGHRPNVDAARWLVEAVLPALTRLGGGELPCLLTGSAMPEGVRALAGGPVEVVGAVDDLMAVWDRVRLTVAPLAFGAGIKGKVLDSLAAGLPCAMTPAAAEGLDLPPLLQRQVAAEPDALAARILALHEDEALNDACRQAGLDHIAAFASEQRIDDLLRATLR